MSGLMWLLLCANAAFAFRFAIERRAWPCAITLFGAVWCVLWFTGATP